MPRHRADAGTTPCACGDNTRSHFLDQTVASGPFLLACGCKDCLLVLEIGFSGVVVRTQSHQDGLRTSHQAGVWFPGKAAELRADVDSMLDAAFAASGTVKALVVPHAAYTYSGQVAAAAFKQMQSLQRTLLWGLGSLEACGTGLMVPPQEYSGYGSPIDSVPIDTEALNALLHTGWYDIAPFALEKAEHSVAVQIPFLRRVLPEGALLLPIYVGSLIDEELPSLGLENHMKKTRNQICGYDALRLFLTSNKIVNPNDSTVGYAAIGFFSSN
ncbi:protein memo-1 homolog [Cyclospora cayetanensis]|uniref:Protein memo-1 homolog n=1 Tax=Cyclospora cayetanensis TaxID=88456 RepID=A0A6P6RPU1_9EIME|nr:protein memo-1 homolog [Cyclospora cayetanensis]